MPRLRSIGPVLAAAISLTGVTSANASTDTIVVTWNDVALTGIRDTHPGPPIVARMLAVVDTCMYDAWTAYDATAVPTRASAVARRPSIEATDENKTAAVSYAAYRAMIDLFPTDPGPANALMAALGFDPGNATTDVTTPAGIGNVACAAVLASLGGQAAPRDLTNSVAI